jgi:hypothetical protein
MPVRRRVLKPDQMGRYRPYLGYRLDGKQQRFNLGTDKAEAERRMSRLYDLWDENVRENCVHDFFSSIACRHFLDIFFQNRRRHLKL